MFYNIGLGSVRFILDTAVGIVFICVAVFAYHMYWGSVVHIFFPEGPSYSIYLGSVAVHVTVANTEEERVQGLSGVTHLGDEDGKLFIFDTDSKPGIWMKDMKFPLDIIWINKDFQIVHIEHNVDPSTYPQVFYPTVDARFVLEVNGNFVNHYKIQEGDRLLLPASITPPDIRANLRNT